ncbi:Hint domain-containing protein [Roseovarius phycicola]|uniref:Hint domain-containing protein n=1 Tax=Roseovarius phycicola TaxID=3080976 RepID=A0ABZ2HKV3_9RHOB
MPDFLNGLFFSEILADNAGGGAVNVNGQGGANKQDEYVEFQNNSNTTIDLDGYQIWSDQNGLLHTFGSGDQIAPGDTATVVGTYNNPPAGFYGANGNNNSASSNGGFLEDGEGNKFDTIYLVAPDGNYIQLSYGSPAQDPGGLPAGFPSGGTLQGAGETLNTSAPNATSVLRDADGNLQEGTPTPGTPGPVCFTSGTRIASDIGDIAVENLEPGARVLSKDRGYVTLRAVRKAPIARTILRWNPDVRCILVPANVLGNSAPIRLSPSHRVLVCGTRVELLFGTFEVLVSAKHLVGFSGIDVDKSDNPVTYFHLLFDTHEVIKSNGCWTESLFLGETAHKAILAATGWQTETGLKLGQMKHCDTARPVLKKYEAEVLVDALGEIQCSALVAA